MVTPVVSARMLDAPALAHGIEDVGRFESEVLAGLLREVGGDVAFFLAPGRPRPTEIGLDPGSLARFVERTPVYEREIAPVKAAALAADGVAVDTEVLGRAGAHRCAYFRDLAAPLGGESTLYGLLTLRGQVRFAIGLGACGRTRFTDAARRAFARVLPSLTLARATYRERAPVHAALTPREREVLDYLCLGYTNAEIGSACGTSPFTVRNQLVSIFGKVGASTRAEAVALARGG